MILMSKYEGQHGGKKGQKIQARPPPPFRAMPERNRFFLCEVFPKSQLHLNIYALGHHNGFFDQLFCRPQALLHHGPSLAGYSTLCELCQTNVYMLFTNVKNFFFSGEFFSHLITYRYGHENTFGIRLTLDLVPMFSVGFPTVFPNRK